MSMLQTPRRVTLLVVLGCALAITSALTAQRAFGLEPCNLCYAQRVPFMIAGLLGAMALTRLMPPIRRALLAVAMIALFVNVGLASYHVGVEQHWWGNDTECGGAVQTPSVEDLMAAIGKAPPVRCDEPQWVFIGITMAGFNVPYSLALALLAAFGVFRTELWELET